MSLDSVDSVGLIEAAISQDVSEKLYGLYVQVYPSMIKGEIEYVTFEDFRKKSNYVDPRDKKSMTREKTKTKEEVMSNVEDIMRNYKI